MKKILIITFSIIIFFIKNTSGQVADTTTYAFIEVPQGFINKYGDGKLKIGVNQFHAVKTKDGKWVTSANALKEFPQQMDEVRQNPSGLFQIIRLRRSDFPQLVEGGTLTKTNE